MSWGKVALIVFIIFLAFAFFRGPTQFKDDPFGSSKEAVGDLVQKGQSLLGKDDWVHQNSSRSYVGGVFKVIEGNCLSNEECNSLNPDCGGGCMCDVETGQCYK